MFTQKASKYYYHHHYYYRYHYYYYYCYVLQWFVDRRDNMHVVVFVFVFAAASVISGIVIHCFRREADIM